MRIPFRPVSLLESKIYFITYHIRFIWYVFTNSMLTN